MHVDVVVVGAGPAGLAAATAAAASGATVTVVDESFRLGGQYLRPRPPLPTRHPVVERFLASGASVLLNRSVWHIDAQDRVVYADGDEIEYGALIIATGAYDRPHPVVGSELRGVVTAGAAQALSKDGVRLGGRVLVAGHGPFALPVASEIIRSGGGLAEIALARLPWMGSAAMYEPAVVGEAVGYGRQLAAHRVRVRVGWVVAEILGSDTVEAAVLVRASGRRRGAQRVVRCDAVALGYGFLPQLALADIAGCELRFDEVQRTWFVDVDDATLQTSVEGVFAAGEVVGIGGHRKALAEGAIAGRRAAAHAGRDTAPTEAEVRDLHRLRRFAYTARRALTPPPLAEAVPDEALVCRCERVSAGEIRAAVRDGAVTVHGVRMRTRAGMGPCQSRMCGQASVDLISAATNCPPDSCSRIAAHSPARPMTIGDLSA